MHFFLNVSVVQSPFLQLVEVLTETLDYVTKSEGMSFSLGSNFAVVHTSYSRYGCLLAWEWRRLQWPSPAGLQS